MADDELEAIRRQRMAELQAKHGVRQNMSWRACLRPPYKEMLSPVCC
uniref:Programmed cell death 5 n=1 Tax=Seriola dumerili TaxID=41447 RepID=A0A3B4V9P9_SERDU